MRLADLLTLAESGGELEQPHLAPPRTTALNRTPSAGSLEHRVESRLGGRGAITATAHKLAVLVYRLLKRGAEDVRQSLEEYTAKVREQTERSRRKPAQVG